MQTLITASDIHAIAAGNGLTEPLQAIFTAHTRKWLLDLVTIHHILDEESPDLAQRSGFASAYADFKRLSPTTIARLISYPAFGYWCVVALELIQRRANRLYPEHHILSHLRAFSRFLIAGTISEGLTISTQAYLDKHAVLALPTLHTAFVAGSQFAGKLLAFSINPNWVTVQLDGAHTMEFSRSQLLNYSDDSVYPLSQKRADGIQLRRAPMIADFIELNDCDEDLKLSERPGAFGALDTNQLMQWRLVFDQGWSMLQASDPALCDEIRFCIKTIVPVLSHSTEVHLSGSYGELWGGIHVSWSPEPLVILEALVHEYRHNKLNALLSADPIIVGPTRENKFYSAFRKDPRPLTGLLHAIFSFQGIVDLWTGILQQDRLNSRDREWAIHRAFISYMRVKVTRDELRKHAVLSDVGEALVSGLEEAAERNRIIEPPPQTRKTILDQLQAHREQWLRNYGIETINDSDPLHLDRAWQAAGGEAQIASTGSGTRDRHSPVLSSRLKMEGLSPELEELLGRSLSGLAEHYLGAQYQLMQHLTVIKLQNPDRYAQIADILDRSPETMANLLLKAHVQYIQGDFEMAAKLYERSLTGQPGREDIWLVYAFTLRHLGRLRAFTIALFYTPLVVHYAHRYLNQGEMRTPTRRGEDAAYQPFPSSQLAFLEWLGEQIEKRVTEEKAQ